MNFEQYLVLVFSSVIGKASISPLSPILLPDPLSIVATTPVLPKPVSILSTLKLFKSCTTFLAVFFSLYASSGFS